MYFRKGVEDEYGSPPRYAVVARVERKYSNIAVLQRGLPFYPPRSIKWKYWSVELVFRLNAAEGSPRIQHAHGDMRGGHYAVLAHSAR